MDWVSLSWVCEQEKAGGTSSIEMELWRHTESESTEELLINDFRD